MKNFNKFFNESAPVDFGAKYDFVKLCEQAKSHVGCKKLNEALANKTSDHYNINEIDFQNTSFKKMLDKFKQESIDNYEIQIFVKNPNGNIEGNPIYCTYTLGDFSLNNYVDDDTGELTFSVRLQFKDSTSENLYTLNEIEDACLDQINDKASDQYSENGDDVVDEKIKEYTEIFYSDKTKVCIELPNSTFCTKIDYIYNPKGDDQRIYMRPKTEEAQSLLMYIDAADYIWNTIGPINIDSDAPYEDRFLPDFIGDYFDMNMLSHAVLKNIKSNIEKKDEIIYKVDTAIQYFVCFTDEETGKSILEQFKSFKDSIDENLAHSQEDFDIDEIADEALAANGEKSQPMAGHVNDIEKTQLFNLNFKTQTILKLAQIFKQPVSLIAVPYGVDEADEYPLRTLTISTIDFNFKNGKNLDDNFNIIIDFSPTQVGSGNSFHTVYKELLELAHSQYDGSYGKQAVEQAFNNSHISLKAEGDQLDDDPSAYIIDDSRVFLQYYDEEKQPMIYDLVRGAYNTWNIVFQGMLPDKSKLLDPNFINDYLDAKKVAEFSKDAIDNNKVVKQFNLALCLSHVPTVTKKRAEFKKALEAETDPVPFDIANNSPGINKQALANELNGELNKGKIPKDILVVNGSMVSGPDELETITGSGILVCAAFDLADKSVVAGLTPLEKSIFFQNRPIRIMQVDFKKSPAKEVQKIKWIAYDPVLKAYYCGKTFTMLKDSSEVVYRVMDFMNWQDMYDVASKKPIGGGWGFKTMHKAEADSYSKSENGFDVLADSTDFFKKYKKVDKNAQFPYTIGLSVKSKPIVTPAAGGQVNSTWGVKKTFTPALNTLPGQTAYDKDKEPVMKIIKSSKLRFVDVQVWKESSGKMRPSCIPQEGDVIEIMFPGMDQTTCMAGDDVAQFAQAYGFTDIVDKIAEAVKTAGKEPQIVITFRNKNINV